MAYLVQRETQTSASAQLSQPEYTLYLSVQNCSAELQQIYRENALKHNDNIYHNDFPDSGFDVFVPKEQVLNHQQVNKVDLFIKCEMVHHVTQENIPSGFYLFPRSSISKTKFRLANNVGIIDSGYRGNLCGVFDILNLAADKTPYEQYQRLVQICSNTLEPFKVILVDDIDKLGTTERGEGGFGSTGVCLGAQQARGRHPAPRRTAP